MTEPAHLCVTLETCDLGDLRVVGGRDGREEVINTAGADSMTLPSYLSSYLLTYLPSYFLTYLPSYLHPPSYLLTYPPSYLLTYPPFYVLTHLPT